MSFYDDNQIQHHLQHNDKHLIQLPKIIVQPGPSPFASRKRTASQPLHHELNKISTVNMHNSNHAKLNNHLQSPLIYLDKSSAEQLNSINQNQIQLYQMNEADTSNDHLDNSISSLYPNNLSQNDQLSLDQTELINQFHTNTQTMTINSNEHTLGSIPTVTNLSNSNCNNTNRNYIQSSTPKRKSSMQQRGNSQIAPSSIVPTLTNVDEIFHLLSQKIAKYCQILADLTNCEVFYKAQLPITTTSNETLSKSAKKTRSQGSENKMPGNNSNQPQGSLQKSRNLVNNTRKRSLYWGTHQMLFQYSHNQGLKYDKSGGDSLIKINQRSISNDVTNLIEEILNAPNLQEDTISSSRETSPALNKYISKTKNNDEQIDSVKSTVQLIDTEIEGISLGASTPIGISTQDTSCLVSSSNQDTSINNPSNEFNLINELSQAESEEFLNELNSNTLKITNSQVVQDHHTGNTVPTCRTTFSNQTDSLQINHDPNGHQDDESPSTPNETNNQIDIKDCCVYLNPLDDAVIEDYLNKFEMKYNSDQANCSMGVEIVTENHDEFEEESIEISNSLRLNELPDEEELYSDQFRVNLCNKFSTRDKNNNSSQNFSSSSHQMVNAEEQENDQNDEDESNLVEKSCLGLSENNEHCFTCELCPENENVTFEHLTQLKIHQLRVHENIKLDDDPPYQCKKCGQDRRAFGNSHLAFIKHSLTCYYPDIYTCKTCTQMFDTYSQYLFHTRYIHTHVVYMCAICSRKYKHIKDLLDHDQLMHSKSLNYCEICLDAHKSRNDLYEHYKNVHMKSIDLMLLKDLDQLGQTEPIESTNSNSTNNLSTSFLDHSLTQESLNLITDQSNKSIELNPTDLSSVLNVQTSISSFVLTDQELDKNPHKQAVQQTKNNEMYTNWGKVQKNDLIRGLLDRKHQCKWCSLRFYTKSQLKQHETSHMNSVLYCPVCDKQFTHKDRLSGHMKCHMEPSLECKVCGKKFKRLCNLYNHELVHGLTEHAFMLCQFCGRGFRSRRDYQNHVIANHRDQLMKTDNIATNQEAMGQPNVAKKITDVQNRRCPNTNRKAKTNTQPKTTTIILNSEQNSLDNQLLTDIEPGTYFTRTDVHHFENLDEISQSDGMLTQMSDETLS